MSVIPKINYFRISPAPVQGPLFRAKSAVQPISGISMLKIFAANGSIALASVILLEEVEADYELSVLDFSRNEQKEAAIRPSP